MSRVGAWIERYFGYRPGREPRSLSIGSRTLHVPGDRFNDPESGDELVLSRFDRKALPFLGVSRTAVLADKDGRIRYRIPETELKPRGFVPVDEQ